MFFASDFDKNNDDTYNNLNATRHHIKFCLSHLKTNVCNNIIIIINIDKSQREFKKVAVVVPI